MNPIVRLQTNYGDILIEVDTTAAPITGANFLRLVKEGFYDGTIFHRIIDNFMIQGGGFTPDMKQKTAPEKIQNEADNGLKNNRGSIAMARTSDPHSAGSQFFINVVNNDFLNFRAKTADAWGYCVFAHVTEGLDIIDKMKVVKTGSKAGHQDVPLHDVVLEKAEIVKSTDNA